MCSPGLEAYRSLPKVELHRHLEGSVRLETMLDVARKHGMTVPASVVNLSRLVQVQDQEPQTFENFLGKFHTLRMFYRSPEVIDRITREAIEDASKDNIRYLELRFTPVALSRAERFPLHDVMEWVCASAEEGAKKYGVTVRLIASVNRHESLESAEQVIWLAAGHCRHRSGRQRSPVPGQTVHFAFQGSAPGWAGGDRPCRGVGRTGERARSY